MNTSLDLHRRRFPRAIRGRGQSRSVRPFNLSSVPRCVAAANKGGPIPVQLREPTNNAPAELEIFDHIGEDLYGDGVSAASVSAFLARHRNDDVDVLINSPGGFVYEGFQMFNDLVSHRGRVVVEIKGLAFSAASVIAMAGDWVKMHKTSDWGIHRAMIMAFGNQKEMRSMASWLNTLDEHAIDVYQERSGQPRSKIVKWIDGESDGTLFSATQCLELGFCDEVIQPAKLTSTTSNRSRSTGSASKSVLAARNRLARLRIRLP